jgi:hypothetical protein
MGRYLILDFKAILNAKKLLARKYSTIIAAKAHQKSRQIVPNIRNVTRLNMKEGGII